ncbi:hypothetical protein PG996_006195 [Apiospora saccharicola]|uniref:Uncharacterized protein n=1 Tax=Apiospora saccharicola TaxID=335842 RepID=A0ABR1VPQ3_9PEZI
MTIKKNDVDAQQASKPPEYRAMRLYHRHMRAWPLLDRVLSASAAYVALPADKQDLIHKACQESIMENIEDFEDHMPPRAKYNYQEVVLAAVKAVVYWNPDVIAWNEDDWTIPVDVKFH